MSVEERDKLRAKSNAQAKIRNMKARHRKTEVAEEYLNTAYIMAVEFLEIPNTKIIDLADYLFHNLYNKVPDSLNNLELSEMIHSCVLWGYSRNIKGYKVEEHYATIFDEQIQGRWNVLDHRYDIYDRGRLGTAITAIEKWVDFCEKL